MKKLYLKSSQYNSYIILNELSKKIYQNGGFIVSTWEVKREKIKIYNRTLLNNIDNLKETIQTITNNLNNNNYEPDRIKQLKEYKETKEKALEELSKIKNNKIVYNTSYLQFKLDNYIYYVQFNENPFFENYLHKEPIDEIKDNKYIVKYNHYIDTFSANLFDNIDLFDYNLSSKDIKKVVNILYNHIVNSKASETIETRKRKYCYNCNKYYYECIKDIRIKEYKEVK